MSERAAGAVVGEAIAAAGAELEAARDRAAGEQLPMFEVPSRFSGPRREQLQRALDHQRRAGRPPGARNRSTEDMRRYLLGRGADPLQRLVEWGLHTPTSLAAELGCSRLEAFRELRAMWESAAPFFYGRAMPVGADGQPVPFLQMFFGGQGAGDAPREPWKYLEGNQPLGAPTDPVSHAAVSHEPAK